MIFFAHAEFSTVNLGEKANPRSLSTTSFYCRMGAIVYWITYNMLHISWSYSLYIFSMKRTRHGWIVGQPQLKQFPPKQTERWEKHFYLHFIYTMMYLIGTLQFILRLITSWDYAKILNAILYSIPFRLLILGKLTPLLIGSHTN